LECYIKDEAAKLFRINQSIATYVQQYQKAFGFGTWNAAQEGNNWLLDRQMVQWETDLKAISESLQRLESTRRQEIATAFEIPDAKLRATNGRMQQGEAVLQSRKDAFASEKSSDLAESVEQAVARSEKYSSNQRILYSSEDLTRLSTSGSELSKKFREFNSTTLNFCLLKQFESLVLEVSQKTGFQIMPGEGDAHSSMSINLTNADDLTELDVAAVCSAWEAYQKASSNFRVDKNGTFSHHPAQQHSIECLVGMCCYCFVFNKLSQISYVEIFGLDFGPDIDLEETKLRHFLLKNKSLEDVAFTVHGFLKVGSRGCAPLFNLNHKSGSLQFGQRFSELHLQSQFTVEQQNDCARIQRREEEKERRRIKIECLNSQIRELEEKVRQSVSRASSLTATMPVATLTRQVRKTRYDHAKHQHIEFHDQESYANSEYTRQKSQLRQEQNLEAQLKREINGKQGEITALRKKIDPVMSPLPSDSRKRNQVSSYSEL
jgi:hypothetical protein